MSGLFGRHAYFAYGAVFIGVTGHASSEFFSVLSGVTGPEVSVWRYLIGGYGLVLWALLVPKSRDLWTPLKEDGGRIVLLSFGGVALPYLAFHWSLDFASVVQVATLITTMPIFIGLTNLVANRVPLRLPKIISALCAVTGIVLLLTDGYVARLAGSSSQLTGIGLALICAALGSAYAVLVRPIIARHGALRVTAISMAMGGIMLWLLVGGAWNIWVNPLSLFDRPPTAAYSLLTLGLWNTTITQVLWLGGLAAVPDITRGSYLFFLKPVIAALLAYLILTQPITAIQIIAILVICGSVFIELIWPSLIKIRGRA